MSEIDDLINDISSVAGLIGDPLENHYFGLQ